MERARNELLPYILGRESILILSLLDLMDDEEEVLLALAEVLGPQFMDYVGGPAHALTIIRILEKMC
jgi:serine/threonine-protein phosphatase 2A regulatory subunit A